MRLIDADEFIKQMKKLYFNADWDKRDIHFSLADIIFNIDMMPTIDPRADELNKLTDATIAHHKTPLTTQNVNDINISLNPDNIIIKKGTKNE